MINNNELINKAMPLVIANQFSQAATVFDQVSLERINDYRVTKGAGIAYLYTQQFQKALTSFKLSVAVNPNQADVHNFIGDLYKKINNFSLAIDHFSFAIKLSPSVWQFHYNAALCFILQENFSLALPALINALKLNTSNTNQKVVIALAKTYQNLANFIAAKNTLEDALKISPNSSALYFHLAEVLEDLQAFEAAINAYTQALAIEQLPHYYESLAIVQLNIGEITQSITTVEKGLGKFPENNALLKLHSNLAYETSSENPFQYYEKLLSNKTEPTILIDYANALINSANYAHAEEVLSQLQRINGFENDYLLGLCKAYKAQHQYHSVVNTLEAIHELTPDLEIIYIEALIAQGNCLLAEQKLTPYLVRFPFDQYYLALYTCILEQTDQAKYDDVCNYETLVFREELIFPPHYGNIENFNKALRSTLEEIHVTTNNPISQSVIGGKQTPGNLFNKRFPVIQELKSAFLDTFKHATSKHNTFDLLLEHHPLKRQLSTHIDFSAAWSIWLTTSGFHQSHIHTKGWFSSAYYVDCPQEINDSSHAGYLHLGAPSLFPFKETLVKKWVKPESGILAIFPSYIWHGTVPFTSEQPRIVVAADYNSR